jgi:hypothetical protein
MQNSIYSGLRINHFFPTSTTATNLIIKDTPSTMTKRKALAEDDILTWAARVLCHFSGERSKAKKPILKALFTALWAGEEFGNAADVTEPPPPKRRKQRQDTEEVEGGVNGKHKGDEERKKKRSESIHTECIRGLFVVDEYEAILKKFDEEGFIEQHYKRRSHHSEYWRRTGEEPQSSENEDDKEDNNVAEGDGEIMSVAFCHDEARSYERAVRQTGRHFYALSMYHSHQKTDISVQDFAKAKLGFDAKQTLSTEDLADIGQLSDAISEGRRSAEMAGALSKDNASQKSSVLFLSAPRPSTFGKSAARKDLDSWAGILKRGPFKELRDAAQRCDKIYDSVLKKVDDYWNTVGKVPEPQAHQAPQIPQAPLPPPQAPQHNHQPQPQPQLLQAPQASQHQHHHLQYPQPPHLQYHPPPPPQYLPSSQQLYDSGMEQNAPINLPQRMGNSKNHFIASR